MQTADFLLERLAENGIRRIYGYPGDGINAIIGALERHKDKLEFVQVRHEEQAAFMACAHAKWTGEVGVQPERELGVYPLLERRHAKFVQATNLCLREILVREVAQRRSAPQVERVAQKLRCVLGRRVFRGFA